MYAICRSSSCATWTHLAEEQRIYEPAIEAYDRYLEILAECKSNYQYVEEEEQNNE